ncbi:MAG: hypothetical protein NVS3B20_26180 [Polyangiales bacterium]
MRLCHPPLSRDRFFELTDCARRSKRCDFPFEIACHAQRLRRKLRLPEIIQRVPRLEELSSPNSGIEVARFCTIENEGRARLPSSHPRGIAFGRNGGRLRE